MSFFHKKHHEPLPPAHEAFWSNTKYQNKNAKLFDALDKRNPNHLDSFENFMIHLDQKIKQKSTNQVGSQNFRPSIINDHACVAENQCVVSLILKGIHAEIVIESLDNNGIRRMDWFDFIVKQKKNTDKKNNPRLAQLNRQCFGFLANPDLLFNKREIGMVRYCPTNNGQPLLGIPEDMGKIELFHKLHWNLKTKSWMVPIENVNEMLKSIRDDFDKCEKGTLKFKLCGHSEPRHSVAPGDILANCTTWAVNKLQAANIHVEIDKNDIANKIVAHTVVVRP